MKQALLRTSLLLALLAGATALAAPTGAAPGEGSTTCTPQQLTSTATAESSQVATDVTGDRLVFISDGNFGGGNPDGNHEVWLRDRSPGTTTQITDTVGAGQSANARPDISDDGTRIAFTTMRNIAGTNPEQNSEVYLFRLDTSAFTPITSTTASQSQHAKISDDGTQIVFSSNANLTGGNADLNAEIFRHLVGGSTIQLTNTTGSSGHSHPAPDADGSRVAFVSSANIGGGNPEANSEIFVWDTADGPLPVQITDSTAGTNTSPDIDDTGTVVVWESESDLTGDNADGSSEVFRHLTNSATTTQITDVPTGDSYGVTIDDSGVRTSFESDADIAGLNPDGTYEVFLHDATAGAFTPITSSPDGDSFGAAMAGDGSGVAYESEAVTAANPQGNSEIVLARCGPVQTCDGQTVTVHLAFGHVPTNGADVILGTSGADTVHARGGNDRFCGLSGADTFTGGPGLDRALGGGGPDTLLGQDGSDLLDGGQGNDTLVGQAGSDTCRGQAGTDIAPTCEVRTGIP